MGVKRGQSRVKWVSGAFDPGSNGGQILWEQARGQELTNLTTRLAQASRYRPMERSLKGIER